MAEESVEAGGGDQQATAARPVECRALIAYDAAAAAQARSGGASSGGGSETTGVGSNTNDGSSSSGAASGSVVWEDGTRKANHGFVGLSNQGATCYMNSLLQTLYMTPEFRAALYRWKCEKDEDDDCIPLQLQRLFGQLQLSSRGAVETNALTRSFGWTSSDGFQQHDVQELCKVLFDAFEREVKDTPQSTLVNDLYQGTMTNYVRCKECGKESQSPDTFLELSLVMRPFGSKAVMSSVLESLDYCLKPETLEGDNQYFCDNCQKKVDAVKGCKFSKLPYLLCLQLKRFDYDFTTFTRIKLNDEMRFPLVIDMNPYMKAAATVPEDEEAKDHSPPSDPLMASPTAGEPEGKSCEEPGSSGMMAQQQQPVPDLVDAEGSKCPEQEVEEEVAAMNEEERSFHREWDGPRLIEERGPYVYELYAVLIHSGSALGGHYYAYIRSLEDGEWYNFNDSTVTRIDVATVKRAWGGPWAAGYGGNVAKRPYYRSLGYSGANAYMLMYRRIEPSRNARFPLDSEVPAHVREGVAKDEERAERERQEYDQRLNALTVRLITSTVPEGLALTVSKKDTLAVVREKAWRALKLDHTIPLDCLRIREFGDSVYAAQLKEEPLRDEEATMEKLGIMQYRRLFVETRRAGEEWPAIKQTDLNLHLRKYDAATDTLLPHQLVFVPRGCTVGELRQQLADVFKEEAGGDASRVRVAIDKAGATVDYWTKRIETLRRAEARLADDCGVTQFSKVYVAIEGAGEEDKEEGGGGQVEEKGGAQRVGMEGEEEEGGGGMVEAEEEGPESDPMEEALNRETNTWTVKVALIDREEDVRNSQVPADQVVEMKVDRRAKIASLRAKVSSHFGVADQCFKLLVKKHYSLAELKGVDTLVKECNPALFNGSHIYVMRGVPLRDGEHIFRQLELKTRYRPGVIRSAHVERCSKCVEARRAAAAGEPAGPSQGHTEEKVCGDGRSLSPTPPPCLEEEAGPAEKEEEAELGGVSSRQGAEQRAPSPTMAEGGSAEERGSSSSGEEGGGGGGASEFGQVPVECMPVADDYVERLTLVVNDGMSIADVRAKVAEELKRAGRLAEDASPDQVRLRDKMQDRPGKIWRDSDSVRHLMASKLEDTKDVAMQVLEEPERVHDQKAGETVVVVQWFCRRCWSLGARYEFAVSHAEAFHDAMDRLAQQLGVEPPNLRVLTIVYARSLKLSDLGKDMPLAGKPWLDPHRGVAPYISDGEVVVCTDVSEPLRELTEAELESVKDEAAASDMQTHSTITTVGGGSGQRASWSQQDGASSSYSWKRPAEKGVKIRTKEERMKEAEKQQQQQQQAAASSSSAALPEASAGGSKGSSGPRVGVSDVVHTGQVITSLFDDIDAEEEERPAVAGGQEQEEGGGSAVEARESAEYMGL